MVSATEIYNISQKDLNIIESLIDQFPTETPRFIANRLSFLIGPTTIEHYVAIGHVIGYILGTGKILGDINHNISPCQRQN